jgi:hypothetical protein
LVLTVVIIAVRWLLHDPPELQPILAPEVPDTWWAGLLSSHDFLLHGYDAGEWLILVNAYLDGTTSFLTRPPAYPLMAAGLAKIVGHRILALHLVGHIASVLVCLGTYVLGCRLSTQAVAVGAALIMATAPRVIEIQDAIGAFPVLTLALVLMVMAAHRAADQPSLKRGLWLGLAAAFCLTAHYTSAPLVLPILLLVPFLAGRSGVRTILLAVGTAAVVAGALVMTVPARPVHSGQVPLAEFYVHALNHPDGRYLDQAPGLSAEGEPKRMGTRAGLLDSGGPVHRTLTQGPAATVSAMAQGYGPSKLAPMIAGLMLLGIGWPRSKGPGVRLRDRFSPAVWLGVCLLPLPFAAAALQGDPDNRYMSFALPFLAIGFARGLTVLGGWAGTRIGQRSATVLAALGLSMVLIYQVVPQLQSETDQRHMQLQRHELAQGIRAHFGTGRSIVGPMGQLGPISAYAALTGREICALGSRRGTCLNGRLVRPSMSECAAALLTECVRDEPTPYVLDLHSPESITDPHTIALNAALTTSEVPVVSQPAHKRTIHVYALEPQMLRALAEGAR